MKKLFRILTDPERLCDAVFILLLPMWIIELLNIDRYIYLKYGRKYYGFDK